MKTWKKKISAIISYALVISMLFSSFSVNALAATEEYTELELGVETDVVFDGEDTRVTYQFTTTVAGCYKIYLEGATEDVSGWIADEEDTYIPVRYSISASEPGGYAEYYDLQAGKTYYYKVECLAQTIPSMKIGVKQVTGNPTSITIKNGTEIYGQINNYGMVELDFEPKDCIPPVATWTSSDSTIVDVEGNETSCWLSYVAVGTATVTATTTDGLTATIAVVINEIPELEVGVQTAVTLKTSEDSVYYKFIPEEDGTYMIYSSGDYDSYCTLFDLNWSDIASDDDSGENNNFKLYYNLKGGETYYFSFNCYDYLGASFNVILKELTEPAKAITITEGTELCGYVGKGRTITAEFMPEDCILEDITWSSSDTSVAVVANNGIQSVWVNFVAVGTATVTATTTNGLTASITVTVKEIPELELNVETETIIKGEEETYYYFTPEKDGAYKFYSINGKYRLNISLYEKDGSWLDGDYNNEGGDGNFAISYNLKGGVTYLIRVQNWSSLETNFSIAVKELTEPATSIEIDGNTTISGYVGEQEYLTSYLLPLDCIPQDITWTTSDASVATVYANSNMKQAWVYFIAPGTATITATTEAGLSVTITVIVKEIAEIKVGEQLSLVFNGKGMEEPQYLKFVPEESGTYKFALNGTYVNISLHDEQFNYIAAGQDNVLIYALEAGETYYFRLSSWNVCTVTATIEETVGVSKLEIVSYPKQMEYYKGVDNYYDLEGLKLKVTFEDGSIVNWEYGDDNPNGYTVSWSGYYEESTQSETRYVITCGGKTVEFSFVLIDNPVDCIKLYSGEIPELIENVDGYENWNEIFIYNTAWARELQFEIVYLDGTTKIFKVGDGVDGYYVSYNDNQWETQWTLGNDNYLTVTYAGRTLDLQVTIAENPVEEIVLNSTPLKEYIWGDYTFGEIYDDIYYFYPSDFTGISFTVKFKDGTTKTVTDADLDEDGCYDGYEVVVYESECEEAGSVAATLSYMGCKFKYNVTVKETGVSSIEVIKDPNVTEYEYWYEPDFEGMQVKITYTDGTSEIVEFTEENLQYNISSNLYCSVDTGDSLIAVIYDYETETYRIAYQGIDCLYDGITFTEGKEISSVEVDNVSIEMVGMNVKVTYADGTVDNLTILEVLDFELYEDSMGGEFNYIDAYVRTEAGITYCFVETGYDRYGVYIFGEDITIEKEEVVTIIGDVNNDGEVNNLDRLILTRHLANWEGYEAETLNLEAADVNGDGEVNNLDRLILTRHLANWEGYEELPYETNTDSDDTDSDDTEDDTVIEDDDDMAWGPLF